LVTADPVIISIYSTKGSEKHSTQNAWAYAASN